MTVGIASRKARELVARLETSTARHIQKCEEVEYEDPERQWWAGERAKSRRELLAYLMQLEAGDTP